MPNTVHLTYIFFFFTYKQLSVQGFIVSRWKSRYPEAIKQMAQWIQEGKIKYDETIVEGFEKMPEAFIGLLTGSNLGKMIVKAWKINNDWWQK